MTPMPPDILAERVRSTATRQALPLLLAWLLAAGAGLVALSIALPAGINWLAAILGAATMLSGLALTIHAALRNPASLRSDAHSEILRPIRMPHQDNATGTPAWAPHPGRAAGPGNTE